MRLLLIVFIIAFLSEASSWWLSDHEFFYDDTGEGASIYNSINDTITRIHYTNAGNDTGRSYSRDLGYIAEFTERSEMYRPPMRPVFSVVIHDISRNISHDVTVSRNDKVKYQLYAFKWSHGSAFAFELDDETKYYVLSPGQTPIKISHDGLIGSTRFKRHTDMMIPGGFMGSEGEFEFSPSDQYLVYSSSADNSTKKVIMTTYSRTENYDVQYSMDYRQNGEEKLSVPSIFIFSVEEKMTLTMDVQIASS
ncbi:hypothetical protein PRIPAC_86516 [Pristionchus pacificus]|uniref:DPPIV_N domain-containing protein n=1 Tax=Pristionchus pacificus TaxID=54126 RepID=A0A2A6BST6_PRIPA|nr:hypothetical protein PRIPAC_86516 [Pristionchus pacificus]|eukprot:PDM68831.1 hypothetical protein PRIPAC_47133 [Pristionchus pacificus]